MKGLKLTEDDVRAIHADNGPLAKIARTHGVSIGTVSRIRSGQAWRRLRLKRRKPKTPIRTGCHRASKTGHLTEKAARAIHADNRPVQEIAAAYGVTSATVSKIRYGQTWQRLGLPPRPRRRQGLDEEIVRAIHADPRIYQQIADTHGTTTATVCRIKQGVYEKTLGLGPAPTRRRGLDEATIRAIYWDPRGYSEIAKACHVSVPTVCRIKRGYYGKSLGLGRLPRRKPRRYPQGPTPGG